MKVLMSSRLLAVGSMSVTPSWRKFLLLTVPVVRAALRAGAAAGAGRAPAPARRRRARWGRQGRERDTSSGLG